MAAAPPRKDYYIGQGGWDGSTWDGVVRVCFVFRDWLQAGGCLAAGVWEGAITRFSAAKMAEHLPHHSFAGIVCVAD